MKTATLAILISFFLCLPMKAEVSIYFDEAEYLSALAVEGLSTLREGFENDNAWGLVRTSIVSGSFSAPDIASMGVTWNGSGGGVHGVTTSEGAARHGQWGFYSSPHVDLASGINDGYVVTSPQPMYGFGGWMRGTYGADVVLILDGDEAQPIELGEICGTDCIDRNLANTPFVGIIDPTGFSQVEVRETEGGGDEAIFLWSDDFTLGFQTLPSPRTPGTAWNSLSGGFYDEGTNWDGGNPPTASDNAVFHLGSASFYSVGFRRDEQANQLVVANDQVALDLGGFRYELTQANPTRESILVGELPGDDGRLVISNGTLQGVHAVVAHSTNSTGQLQVSSGATLSLSGGLRVGSGGTGAVEVTSGAAIASSLAIIGQLGGEGTVQVHGAGAALNAGSIFVGLTGDGTLWVSDDGDITSRATSIGSSGDGQVVLDGAGTEWMMQIGGSARATLRVGEGDSSLSPTTTPTRTGTLTIRNGATLTAEESYVGDRRNGTGIVTVSGDESEWRSNTSGNLFVGHEGNGQLNVLEGGTVHSGQVLIGRSGVLDVTRGMAHVDGAGSTWNASAIWVGYNFTTSTFSNISDGELTVTGGATVSAAQVNVGARNAAHGAVLVEGEGSTLSATTLRIGPTDAFVFNNEALLQVGTGGVVDVTQDLSLDHGHLALLGGTVRASQVWLNRGQLSGAGTIQADVQNGAQISPGNLAGAVTIEGEFVQTAGGHLSVDLGGLEAVDEFDVLQISGAAQLEGALELRLIDVGNGPFEPTPGNSFEFLRATGGVVGTFGEIQGVAVSDDWGLAVSYQDNAVVAVTALLGDANLDSVVDASDFNLWNEYKFTSGTTWARGDFNGDGNTDTSDFNIWNEHKFTSVTGIAAVPEPSHLMLAAWALAGTVAVIRRSVHSHHPERPNPELDPLP